MRSSGSNLPGVEIGSSRHFESEGIAAHRHKRHRSSPAVVLHAYGIGAVPLVATGCGTSVRSMLPVGPLPRR
jgi:hypothetical protein